MKVDILRDNIRINEDIAYFIGVLHSDGCVYNFHDKEKGLVRRLNLTVAEKSLPMAKKFQEILEKYFYRRINIRKRHNLNLYVMQTSINKIYFIFKNWKKGKIPKKIKENKFLFGAYLAGLIDGDGHIKFKKNKDRILHQSYVSISDERKSIILKNLIKKYMKCGAHIYEYKKKNCYDTCFYITYKNSMFLEKFVLPHLTIPYKIEKINNYNKKIKWAYRDSKFSAARLFSQTSLITRSLASNDEADRAIHCTISPKL